VSWKEKIKDKVIEIIIAIIVIPLLSIAVDKLVLIAKNVSAVPEVQKNLNDFISDQAENNKTYNGMLYTLNKWMRETRIADSIKRLKR
jgi:fructose-specific phosphotransferase system IIC component